MTVPFWLLPALAGSALRGSMPGGEELAETAAGAGVGAATDAVGAGIGSIHPVLGAILGGISGLRGGIPGIAGGVLGGLDLSYKDQRDQEMFQEKLRAAQLENEQVSGLYERGLADLEEMTRADERSIAEDVAGELSSALDSAVPDDGGVAPPALGTGPADLTGMTDEDRSAAFSLPSLVASQVGRPAPSQPVGNISPSDIPYAKAEVQGPQGWGTRRRFNVDALRTLDPDIIGEHVAYTEGATTDEEAQKRGYNSRYDVTFGFGKHDPLEFQGEHPPISEWTLGEVYSLQKQMKDRQRAEGTDKYGKNKDQPTSAVGRYQFIEGTLREAAKELGYDDSTVFSPEVQDSLFKHQLNKVALNDLRAGKISEREAMDLIRATWEGAVPNDPSKLSVEKRPGAAALIAKPASQVKGYAELVRDQQSGPPADLAAMPPEQRAQVMTQERARFEEMWGVMQQQASMSQTDPAMARMVNDEYQKADEFDKIARRMMLIGTPQQQAIGASILSASNVKRNSALGIRETMNSANTELFRAAKEAHMQSVKAGDGQNLATHKAGLAAQNKAMELQLKQINDLEELDVGLEGRALLAEQKQVAERNLLEVKAAQKDANDFPDTIEQIKDQRDILGDIYYAQTLAERLWPNQSGFIADWLPNFSEDVQELEAILNTINAPKIRKAFGGNMAVQESMIGLKGMGPSLKMDKGAILNALRDTAYKATQEYETLISTKAPLFTELKEPVPEVVPGSRYEKFEAQYKLKLLKEGKSIEATQRQSPSELRRRAAESVPMAPRPDFRRRQ